MFIYFEVIFNGAFCLIIETSFMLLVLSCSTNFTKFDEEICDVLRISETF